MSRLGCFAVALAVSVCEAKPPVGETAPLRIALYDDAGAGPSVEAAAKALADQPDVSVERIKVTDIRAGRLDGYDVLIQPGGSGGGQGRALGEDGRERVRRFVKAGGGYVGICAGAYLASSQYSWSLGVLDAKVVDSQHWARGTGKVELAVTAEGQSILGLGETPVVIHYENGPLLAPAGDPEVPAYRPLATFASEIAENGAPKGVMPGTTAIAAGRFGKGRVLCFSPHPEKTEGLSDVVLRGVVWAAGYGE